MIISGQTMMDFEECSKILRPRLAGTPRSLMYCCGWPPWLVFFINILSFLAFLADKNGLSFVAAEISLGWLL